MPENDPDLRIETTKYRIVEQAQLNTKLGQAERLLSQGVLQDAEALYRDILNVLPGQPEASHGLGLIALHTGNASAAVELMQMAAITLPGDAKIHTNLGLALATAGDAASAESCYLKAIELEENFVDPHLNLANLLLEAGRTAEAADAYADAERLAPDSGPVHYGRSMLEMRRGRPGAAISALRQAIAYAPSLLPARINLANLLYHEGEREDAVEVLEEAVIYSPDSFDARLNLCAMLQQTDRTKEAVAIARDTLVLAPESPELLLNLSTAETADGQPEEAWKILDRAIGVAPDYAPAKLNRAMVRLLLGDLPGAWEDFEARPSRGILPHPNIRAIPAWKGEKLAGKTIIVWAEQGYGDTIQFARFLPRLKALGGRVVFLVPEALAPLFTDFPSVDAMIIRDQVANLPSADFQTPILSLMHYLSISLEDIENQTSYLSVKHNPLPHHPGNDFPIIGICWQGSESNPNDHKRSVAPTALLDRLKTQEKHVIGLQYGAHDAPIENPGAGTANFGEMATLIMACDLVISVDTSVAHLAGALGKSVWTLLPYAPDWRWGLNSQETPWYPTMRLFRQSEPGNWDSVFVALDTAFKRYSFS